MPAPRHLRIRYNGTFGDTDQTWSVSWAYGPPGSTGVAAGGITDDELAALAQAIRLTNSSGVVPGNIASMLSSLAWIRSVRTSVVGPNGREELVAETTLASAATGQGTPLQPTEVALVASLRTGLPGQRRRGRMYLPALAIGVTSEGRVAGDSQARANAVAGWIATVRGQVQDTVSDVNMLPVVASTVGGFLTEITAVQMGNVFDVQRRRRNQQREAYSIAAVPG